MRTILLVGACLAALECLSAPPDGWRHSGEVTILTTPDGADLPAGTRVRGFPLLVRLHGDSFPFAEARPDGADLRVASGEGQPLPHQIESWDAAGGAAAVWVRVPEIRGNDAQTLRLAWGRDDAPDVSDGRAVFGAESGFAGVWHMGEEPHDEVGDLPARDTGTTAVAGVVGMALRMAHRERIKVAVYALIWLVLLHNRRTDLGWIVAASQAIFSEQILSKLFRLEWLRIRFERTFDDVFRLFQTKPSVEQFKAHALDALTMYEAAKANAGITLSSKIFDDLNPTLSTEWDNIKATLKI